MELQHPDAQGRRGARITKTCEGLAKTMSRLPKLRVQIQPGVADPLRSPWSRPRSRSDTALKQDKRGFG